MTLFQDANGDVSMMRVLAFVGFFLGAGVIATGLVGWGCGLEQAAVIIGTGAALAGGGELFKMLQKKAENGKAG